MSSAERWDFSQKDVLSSVCSSIKRLYLIFDSHKREKNINRKHLKQALHFIRTVDASLIVEDPNTFNNKKLSLVQLYQYLKRKYTPIRNFASLAHHCGVLATSVEFRPRTSPFCSKVFISDIIASTKKEVAKIAAYDDGPVLNAVYREYVDRFNSLLEPYSKKLFANIVKQGVDLEYIDYDALEYPQEADKILNFYEPFYSLQRHPVEEKVEKVITRYAQEVVDCKMLHALVGHAKLGAHTTVIYGGGSHINAIKSALEKLGYHFSRYGCIRFNKENNELLPLDLPASFKKLDPTYDPNAKLPITAVDCLFVCKEVEEEYSGFLIVLPAVTLLSLISYIIKVCCCS